MAAVYIVRCNFKAPHKEDAWNYWYSGPKIVQMLEKPFFRSCQRFRRLSGNGRNYLALWTMLTPEALRTPEYLAQWGFDEWAPDISDWSRDLFDSGARAERDFAVPPGDTLEVIAFDGMTASDAETMRRDLADARPDMIWLPVIGLDRHTPSIGLRALKGEAGPARPATAGIQTAIQAAIYSPISQFHVAGGEPLSAVP